MLVLTSGKLEIKNENSNTYYNQAIAGIERFYQISQLFHF